MAKGKLKNSKDVAPALLAGEEYLGDEEDGCAGHFHGHRPQLAVKNSAQDWINIPLNEFTTVDVTVNYEGYWWWKCGNTEEKSRGRSPWRRRVNRLKVLHKEDSGEILWFCYYVS